jgi:hypothetical protein
LPKAGIRSKEFCTLRRRVGFKNVIRDIVRRIWTKIDPNTSLGGGRTVSGTGAIDVQPDCGVTDNHDGGDESEKVWDDGLEYVIRLSTVCELGFVFREQAGVVGVLEQ